MEFFRIPYQLFYKKKRGKQITQGKSKHHGGLNELSTSESAGSFLEKKICKKLAKFQNWRTSRAIFFKTQGIAACAGIICKTDCFYFF